MPVDNSQLLRDNLEATNALAAQVKDLSGRLSAKEILHRRTRRLGWAAVILGIICVLGIVGTGYLAVQTYQNTKTNALNAKINCENSNQMREANRKIWTTVAQASSGDPNRTPQDIHNTQVFQDYINKMYAPRDCNDLDRRYSVPDPPEFKF